MSGSLARTSDQKVNLGEFVIEISTSFNRVSESLISLGVLSDVETKEDGYTTVAWPSPVKVSSVEDIELALICSFRRLAQNLKGKRVSFTKLPAIRIYKEGVVAVFKVCSFDLKEEPTDIVKLGGREFLFHEVTSEILNEFGAENLYKRDW